MEPKDGVLAAILLISHDKKRKEIIHYRTVPAGTVIFDSATGEAGTESLAGEAFERLLPGRGGSVETFPAYTGKITWLRKEPAGNFRSEGEP